jgi:hypothetical protein
MGLATGDRLFEYGIGLILISAFGPSLLGSLGGGITGSQTMDTVKTVGIILIAIGAYKELKGM